MLWAAVLVQTVALVPLAGARNVYGRGVGDGIGLGLGEWTKWTQTLAVLEVLHVALGLLRSSLFTTVIQIASRLLLVWGVCDRYMAPRASVAYPTMLFAWAVTEVCRYPYYIAALNRSPAPLLQWLRYNTFFVLYPLGAGSEAWCIWTALSEARRESVSYYWFLCFVLATYVPGWFPERERERERGRGLTDWQDCTISTAT